jgi:NAD(P)-dependent dehydrogenase (short-subunit alcohol dehydrogenase family)
MLFETKFWGPYYAAKYAVPYLNENSSITLFSGAAGIRPVPGLAVFGAVDGAIEALVRALSWELRPIRVNAVSPGFMATPLFDFMPVEQRDHMFEAAGAMLPTHRMGKPDDTAQAAVFLMQNGYSTGQTVYVDGGHCSVEYSDLVMSGGKA